jgi:hypothetical protein
MQIHKSKAGNKKKSFSLHSYGSDGALTNLYSSVHDFWPVEKLGAEGLAYWVWLDLQCDKVTCIYREGGKDQTKLDAVAALVTHP